MNFFRSDESKRRMTQILVSWIKWIDAIRERRHERQQVIKNRHELLKLGQHLLKDLGFDPKGYPLSPDSHEYEELKGNTIN